jgi:uncharacterized RDD family membrane protein YckC
MSEHNPFQPPGARLEPSAPDTTDLAGRWVRLGAVLLDGVLQFLIILPLMYFGGYFELIMESGRTGQPVPYVSAMIWGLIGFAMFVLVQGWPLHQYGQTWGKRIVAIKIVDLAGAKPSINQLLWRRYLPLQLLNFIPVLGPIIGLVDALLIFRDDRRCLHDMVAGTRVVVVR